MKTAILTLSVALLLLGCGFVACSDSEESASIGTPPVSASEDVSAFFKKYLPRMSSNSHPIPAFNFSQINYDDTECFLINSMEEFKALTSPSIELPVIDFEKYTLIIGWHSLWNPIYTFQKQGIDTQSEEMTLNLVYKRLKGAYPPAVTIYFFWGLYTKLPQKTITVDTTII